MTSTSSSRSPGRSNPRASSNSARSAISGPSGPRSRVARPASGPRSGAVRASRPRPPGAIGRSAACRRAADAHARRGTGGRAGRGRRPPPPRRALRGCAAVCRALGRKGGFARIRSNRSPAPAPGRRSPPPLPAAHIAALLACLSFSPFPSPPPPLLAHGDVDPVSVRVQQRRRGDPALDIVELEPLVELHVDPLRPARSAPYASALPRAHECGRPRRPVYPQHISGTHRVPDACAARGAPARAHASGHDEQREHVPSRRSRCSDQRRAGEGSEVADRRDGRDRDAGRGIERRRRRPQR